MNLNENISVQVAGIGACVTDMLYTVSQFPKEDTKLRAEGSVMAGGGPVATGLVAVSKLGGKSAYLGVLSSVCSKKRRDVLRVLFENLNFLNCF